MSRVIHIVGKTTHTRDTLLQILQRGLVDQPGQRRVLGIDDTHRWTDADMHTAFPHPADDVIALSAHLQPRHHMLAPGDMLIVAHIAKA